MAFVWFSGSWCGSGVQDAGLASGVQDTGLASGGVGGFLQKCELGYGDKERRFTLGRHWQGAEVVLPGVRELA